MSLGFWRKVTARRLKVWVGYRKMGELGRIQPKAKRQVYDIEVEVSPYKPLEDQVPVIDSVIQNPEIVAVCCSYVPA